MKLGKYSIGVGDRFGCQGEAQLQALVKARAEGVCVVPVWNKSEREHGIIGTVPASVRREADEAVRKLGWQDAYFVDADHISGRIVDKYLEAADFFTLDVADFIGGPVEDAAVAAFVDRHRNSLKALPGRIGSGIGDLAVVARKYLPAVKEAGRTYRRVAAVKGEEGFVAEVSMDETDSPQTPAELFLILAAVAEEGIRAQTIAPKFSGRFNKGVDYVGDVAAFEREFEGDVLAVQAAIRAFGLPETLKLSVHSGSDKYSLYPAMAAMLQKHGAGLHLKTAGTTWLEELSGLALSGAAGLELAKEVYGKALGRFDELCKPYATVIDIDPHRLPAVGDVNGWSAGAFSAALRHDTGCDRFNPDLRQLLHVGYKVAAEMGERYLGLVRQNAGSVGPLVSENIHRHVCAVFGPGKGAALRGGI